MRSLPSGRECPSARPGAGCGDRQGASGGGSRSFDFEVDQKLRPGARVFVTDSGALNVH